MKKLRQYQIDISQQANENLRIRKFVYLAMQVRTGKTATALNAAMLYGATNVLFVTKKKAIKSIEEDYNDFGYTYNITVTNTENLHKINGNFDLVISDENHKYGSFPKPSARAKLFKKKYGHLPIIALSGTMTPESYSQVFYQFWISNYSPFKYANFYKWAADYVNVKLKNFGYATIKDYSDANEFKVKKAIEPYVLTYSQQEAGFTSEITENILYVEMLPKTYDLVTRLKRDLIIEGKNEVVLADTAVKLLGKLHQLFSGTVKFESGNSMVIDTSKSKFIFDKFGMEKIAIFYKFKEEYNAIKEAYRDGVTDDLTEFQNTNKSIALQIVSGREGISLAEAKYIVYYNIDYSAVSYWQSRDRLTTIDRMSNNIYWIFAKGGIENHIYKKVMNKKNFTLSHFVRILSTI